MVSVGRIRALRRAMRRTLPGCAVAIALSAASGRAQTAPKPLSESFAHSEPDSASFRAPASRVLTRKEIEAAGWHRMAELLEGATGTSRWSVDGFTYGAAGDRLPAAGASPSGAPEWLVFLDGVRLPVSAFGLQFLELIPAPLLQIDSARFTTGPAIVAGTPAPRGALELFTSRRQNGFYSGASYTRGDETGDPGPFRYTTLASPNVEKIGPFAAASIGYGRARASLDISYHGATFTSSDTNITRRIPAGAFTERNQYNESKTVALRARVHERAGDHALSLSLGQQRGLIFVPHDAGEGDLNVTLKAASLSGNTGRGGTHITYVLGASSMPVETRSVVLATPAASTRSNYHAIVTFTRLFYATNVALSGAATQWRFSLPEISRRTFNQRFALSAARRGGARWFGQVNVGIAHANANTAVAPSHVSQSARFTLDYSASGKFAYSPQMAMLFSVARFEPTTASDGSWIDAAQSGIVNFARPPVMRRALAGVQHQRTPLQVNAFVSASHTSNWELATPVVSSGEAAQSATFLGGHLDAQTDSTRSFFARLSVAASVPVAGSDVMKRSSRNTAPAEARLTFAYHPLASFRTTAVLHAAASTRWVLLAANPVSTAPPMRRVDLSAEKWAFERRMRAQLIFRNLLNQEERYHPLGAQWNFRTEVSLSVVTK